MGKALLAGLRSRTPRLTRRVLLSTLAISVALGGGTAGALISTAGVSSHPARARRAAQPVVQPPVRIDPGGPIILAPGDPSPAPAAPPPPAPPAAPVHPSPPPPPPPPVGAAALAQIGYPWQQLGYQIAFLGPRPDLMGQTIFDEHRIEIYLRDGESRLTVAHVIAHEIGHAVDVAYNTPERRQQWLRLRGASTDQPWFGCSSCDDFSSPAGDYAETFSFWQVGPNADYSQLAPPPSPDELQQLVPLFFASGTSTASGTTSPPPPAGSSGGSAPPPSSNPSPGGQSCLTVLCTSHGQSVLG